MKTKKIEYANAQKQEIVKPQRTGDNFACQTLAFLPTLPIDNDYLLDYKYHTNQT